MRLLAWERGYWPGNEAIGTQVFIYLASVPGLPTVYKCWMVRRPGSEAISSVLVSILATVVTVVCNR